MNRRDQIYLAALLHDIGKFYQRADENSVSKSTHLNQVIKDLEREICPLHKGNYSHKHALWTAQFFHDFQGQLKSLLNIDESEANMLLNISAGHHNPSRFESRIIQKADHYSSGADRSVSELAWKDAEEETDTNWDSFKRIKMNSVFERVSLETSGPKKLEYKLPLTELKLSDDYFPVKGNDSDTVPQYGKLWDEFVGELESLKTRTPGTLFDTLLYLLEKYTTRIPSSTQHLPDVSLYDHLKTTAAFAISLSDYLQDSGRDELPDAEEQPFLLVGGDISGIQQFIYGIIPRRAAKNLKGRSFYLQLLSDTIVRHILRELELYDGNIVYASGGTFYLIAPNTAKVREKIKKMEADIARKMFDTHGTRLYLGMDCVPFGEDYLFLKNEKTIGDLWKSLNEKMGQKKARRFQNLMKNDFDRFFKPTHIGSKQLRDAITGDEISDDENPVPLESGNNELKVTKYTRSQIELGGMLRDTDYIVFSDSALPYFKKEPINPIGLGYHCYFISEKEKSANEDKLRESADRVRVIYFNKKDFLEPVQKGIDNTYGFTFYGGNNFPADGYGHPKTFEEIAGVEFKDEKKEEREKAPSLVRLGVLRMDVDNLGAIFQRGLSPELRTFSRYCTLSRSLDYFFKGYLNRIWESNPEFKEFTQIIYSGGDDLFIVGRWDILPRMASRIREEFSRWTCHNSNLTLSGGMAIVPPKFPLLKAALFAEDFEKAAKGYASGSKTKNAFSFFSDTYYPGKRAKAESDQTHADEELFAFSWEGEWNYLNKLKKQIADLTEANDGLPEGFANDMYNLSRQADFVRTEEGFRLGNYEVIWLAAYKFKRMEKKSNEALNHFLNDWTRNLMAHRIEGAPETHDSPYHPPGGTI